MKKLLGLLAICSLVACNDSSDSVAAPQWNSGNGTQQGNQQGQDTRTPEEIADSIARHVTDSIANAQQQQGYSSMGLSSSPFGFSSSSVGLSSSPVGLSSSSMMGYSSSTTPVRSSSSKVTPKSSSAVVEDGPMLSLWDGSEAHVPVGNMKGGWWYTYDDNDSDGASIIEWEANPGDDGDMTPVIEACGGGICGSFVLDQGDYEWDPFVGFAFGFGANNAFSGDASDLGGICVTYSSDSDIMLELGLTGTAEKKIGYANPFYTLTASSAAKTANISWSQFKQPTWYTQDETKSFFIDGTDAAAELSSLKFKITGESGDRGNFAVTQVGPKGKCK